MTYVSGGDRVFPTHVLRHIFGLVGHVSAASLRCWVTCQTRGLARMCAVLECSPHLTARLLGRWRLTSQHSAALSCSDSCVMYYVLHVAGLRLL